MKLHNKTQVQTSLLKFIFALLSVTIRFRPLTGKLDLRERHNNNWGK